MTTDQSKQDGQKTRGKPFQKGDPRIWRKGRGKGSMNIGDLLRRQGAHGCPQALTERVQKAFQLKGNISLIEAVHWGVWIEALRGEAWAVQYIADRTEGKPGQAIDLTTRDDSPKIIFKLPPATIDVKPINATATIEPQSGESDDP